MRYLFILSLFFLFACNAGTSKQKDIIGKWQFERIERDKGADSLLAEEGDENNNIAAIFDENGKYYSVRIEEGNIDTVQSGNYLLSEDGKQIITSYSISGRMYSDTVTIIDLKDKRMRVQTLSNDTVILKKVN